MKNIELITNFLQKKLDYSHDSDHKTLNIIKTTDGENLCAVINSAGEKEYYRVFNFIENSKSYDNLKEAKNPEKLAYEVGKIYGNFQKLLIDFPVNMLGETIKDFHNTPKRFNDLLQSIENKVTNRAYGYSEEIVDIISRIKECSYISNSLGKTIPLRVTHNDTKLNNVLLDKNTGKGLVVIDLDTVMPGSSLFDLGDGIRSACSNSFEDETDLNKVFLDTELTKAYLEGYLEEMYQYLTPDELNNIVLSIKILTYELSIRFLTDYINGDTYFKIKYKNHNRDRFLNQYALLKDIESKQPELESFVVNKVRSLRK
jgi:thiamine kinase-like enzyme